MILCLNIFAKRTETGTWMECTHLPTKRHQHKSVKNWKQTVDWTTLNFSFGTCYSYLTRMKRNFSLVNFEYVYKYTLTHKYFHPIDRLFFLFNSCTVCSENQLKFNWLHHSLVMNFVLLHSGFPILSFIFIKSIFFIYVYIYGCGIRLSFSFSLQ